MTNKKPSLVKELVDLISGSNKIKESIDIEEKVNEFLKQIIEEKSQVNNEA